MNLDRNQLFNALLSPAAFKRFKVQETQNFYHDSDIMKLPSIKKVQNAAKTLNDQSGKHDSAANRSESPRDHNNFQHSVQKSDKKLEIKESKKDNKEDLSKLNRGNYSAKDPNRAITPIQAKYESPRTSLAKLKDFPTTLSPNTHSHETQTPNLKGIASTSNLRALAKLYKASDTKPMTTENKLDYQDSALKKIITYQDRLKFLESYHEKRRKINEEYTEKGHYCVINARPDWVSPYDSIRIASPKRIKIPKHVPKLFVQAQQAKITTHYDNHDQEENNMFLLKKSPKGKKVTISTQFSYDESGIMRYIKDFAKLVSLSNKLEDFSFKKLADNSEQQEILKRLQHVRQTIKLEEIIEPPTNISEIQDFLKSKWLYLCVLKDQYQGLFRNKGVTERVLQALNIDYKQELGKVTWDSFLLFNRLVLNYELPRPELTNFVLKFFKGHESHISAAQIQVVFRALAQEYQKEHPDTQPVVDLISSLYRHWDEFGILPLRAEFLNEAAFKSIYYNNKLNIQVLLNLITHRF